MPPQEESSSLKKLDKGVKDGTSNGEGAFTYSATSSYAIAQRLMRPEVSNSEMREYKRYGAVEI